MTKRLVKKVRPSQQSLLEAATQVFMESGLSGARVDEIARRARANKAMIYYHFGSKRGLYRAVLLHLFSALGSEVDRLAREESAPRRRLDLLYTRIARHFSERPALPHIMMREVLSGGRGMDAETGRVIAGIVALVRAAVEQGMAAGVFRRVDPLLTHLSMMGPILVYFASRPFRERLIPMVAPERGQPTVEELLAHLQEFLTRGLAPRPGAAPRSALPSEQEHS